MGKRGTLREYWNPWESTENCRQYVQQHDFRELVRIPARAIELNARSLILIWFITLLQKDHLPANSSSSCAKDQASYRRNRRRRDGIFSCSIDEKANVISKLNYHNEFPTSHDWQKFQVLHSLINSSFSSEIVVFFKTFCKTLERYSRKQWHWT